jgi:uncharacterized protein YdiU (UPF0061 family)
MDDNDPHFQEILRQMEAERLRNEKINEKINEQKDPLLIAQFLEYLHAKNLAYDTLNARLAKKEEAEQAQKPVRLKSKPLLPKDAKFVRRKLKELKARIEFFNQREQRLTQKEQERPRKAWRPDPKESGESTPDPQGMHVLEEGRKQNESEGRVGLNPKPVYPPKSSK